MKYILFSLLFFCNFESFAHPTKKNQAQIEQKWQAQYMPYADKQTKEFYSWNRFQLLACLCGPVVMLGSVLSCQQPLYDDTTNLKDKFLYSDNHHVYQKFINQPDRRIRECNKKLNYKRLI